MKPNEARLTPSLEYCITELLNFFPKNFAKNISKFILNWIFDHFDKFFVQPMQEIHGTNGENHGQR